MAIKGTINTAVSMPELAARTLADATFPRRGTRAHAIFEYLLTNGPVPASQLNTSTLHGGRSAVDVMTNCNDSFLIRSQWRFDSDTIEGVVYWLVTSAAETA
jgi:hypothetical protein